MRNVRATPDRPSPCEALRGVSARQEILALDLPISVGAEAAAGLSRDQAQQLRLRSQQLLEACKLAKITTWDLDAGVAAPADAADLSAFDAAVDRAIGPFHPDDRGILRAALIRCITQRTPFDVEVRAPSPSRTHAFYRVVGRCQGGNDGEPVRLTGVCQDITDRKDAETTILQAEKLKSIGELTGGIAHDFNNLLTIISINLEMMLECVAAGEAGELAGLIEPALQATSSGAKLTAHLLAFAQRQPLSPSVVPLGPFLASLRDLAVRTIGPYCTIDLVCPANVWKCLADRVQLESALLNLIVNARDAMPAGGRIVIEAGNVSLRRETAGLSPGDYVRLCVADEGVGVSPDIMNRVFEPFFTTKPVGKGTGLGLSMVLGFARQSNGRVEIESEPGRGTRVSLHLPRAMREDVPEADAPALAPSHWTPPPLRTLVVDDTPEVLRAMTRMCREIGLQAVGAESVEGALELLRVGPDFELLLTDVILPGRFGGAELAREARRLVPAIRVLFTSGYTEAKIVNRAALAPDAELLVKPFTRRRLVGALRKVIEARPS
jgi:signal transduction histidine kinase/CheY-like chemotaxis protein